MALDPTELTRRLIACPSVTPEEGGALVALEEVLHTAGFACTRVDRGGVSNLFARFGPKGAARTFGFNGHTDVVPVGDEAAWTQAPFGANIDGDWLYGRGATDMKSGVAAFVTAACSVAPTLSGDDAIILTITGDEEGPATDGTCAILDWMGAQGEAMDVCLVGEPTSATALG
ncbi:MAG: M20/M25/M40 family metallo-hydrolase, partial [Pseudomonadota bacterium]